MSMLGRRGNDNAAVLTAQLLEAFQSHLQRSTAAMERLAGNVINHVLLVRTATFDATATPFTEDFSVAAGSIFVSNLSTHPVTVVAAGPSSTAPTSGVGVFVVAAGTARSVPLASRQVTLYGTAGDQVSYVIMTSGPTGDGGLNAIDGGSA